MWRFYKALFKNPRAMGSAFPSSKYLARQIAKFIPLNTPGLVIELGPGSGAITRGILHQGLPPQQLIAIENSIDLVIAFRKRFPQVKIIHGNADNLSQFLANNQQPVKTIISSLPLLILPITVRDQIIQEIMKVLMPGGYFIQYTYGTQQSVIESHSQFKKVATKWVILNLPPARIDVFQFLGVANAAHDDF